MVKAVYIITDMNCEPVRYDITGDAREFNTERPALKVAKEVLFDTDGNDTEVWVWRLSHVLSKPDVEPIIEVVK